MDTDRPIKLLFERQGQSLLPFIGETNARVTAAESVALSVASREVDCVLRLERDGAVWYRHLEFQSRPDPDMARRCFEYKAYEWRFDVVRLSEIPVDLAFESGDPGPLALVPLLHGGDAAERIVEAVRRLDALPRPQSADALSVLLDLASQRYTRKTLMSVLGKDRIMQSYLWQMGVDEGRVEGEAKAVRQICLDLAQSLHPRVAKRVLPAIQACAQPATLRAWILESHKLSDAAFVALVTGKPTPPKRTRASRPSRGSRRSVSARKGR